VRAPPDTAAVLARPQLDATFQPRGLLRSPHLQSVLPSLPPLKTLTRRRAAAVLRNARPWIIDCGEGVRLQGFHTPHAAGVDTQRVAVLLHGWEGSADSAHVLSLSVQLWRQGFDIVRLNLRDHGDTHHLNREIFHSCRLPELVGALQTLAAQFAGSRLYLAGFSLGGNFLLRAAADPGLPSSVAGVVAVSPVLDPAATLSALEHGIRVYRRYFVRCWSKSLRTKAQVWPGCYDFDAVLRSADLRRMTTQLIKHTSFAHIDAYLAGYAITGMRLATLRVPAALLLAQDDPIIPFADVARLATSARLRVTLTRHGGHCGFLVDWMLPSFAENYVIEQFARFATTA
jgi:uncharacterized protein